MENLTPSMYVIYMLQHTCSVSNFLLFVPVYRRDAPIIVFQKTTKKVRIEKKLKIWFLG